MNSARKKARNRDAGRKTPWKYLEECQRVAANEIENLLAAIYEHYNLSPSELCRLLPCLGQNERRVSTDDLKNWTRTERGPQSVPVGILKLLKSPENIQNIGVGTEEEAFEQDRTFLELILKELKNDFRIRLRQIYAELSCTEARLRNLRAGKVKMYVREAEALSRLYDKTIKDNSSPGGWKPMTREEFLEARRLLVEKNPELKATDIAEKFGMLNRVRLCNLTMGVNAKQVWPHERAAIRKTLRENGIDLDI